MSRTRPVPSVLSANQPSASKRSTLAAWASTARSLARRASGSTWNLNGTVMLQPRAGPSPAAGSALAMKLRTVAAKPSSGLSMRP